MDKTLGISAAALGELRSFVLSDEKTAKSSSSLLLEEHTDDKDIMVFGMQAN